MDRPVPERKGRVKNRLKAMANRFEKAKEYTKKYKSILLPCKFCGGTDLRITSDRTIFNPRNVWSVDCSCGNCVYGLVKVKDAVKKWNEQNAVEGGKDGETDK